ncbi:hypothetical protein [Pseudonocardia broussonetiae]|uniref:Uncharacterized protein n=1 Tax=Pseudonocardia broussonetiae TaxID=2736640 RepID=A0A6M6JIT3_9PSEU|nr:hypothetical protein [Pseudonocardia broussonetiae]QJY47984.1 hypothetical protein HOP40_21085 [Pseudonocardia broussonetiae]
MIFALLAAYLTKRPPPIQALVVGLCTGLFVATAAEANQRDPVIASVVLLVLTVGAVAGGAFLLALKTQVRRGWTVGTTPPRWVALAYSAVWVLSLVAAVTALFGAGGLPVAVLAVVPIVLLAPPALLGIRTLLGRSPAPDVDARG